MSFQQALSGLNASSASLDAISNNVANSGTVGFKEGQAHFADIFAASLSGNGGAGQIGIGTSMSAVAQTFNEGNITVTNNSLDLAINGQGFFKLGNGNYTRNGQFHVDGTGNIVNDQGQRLQGYNINSTTGLASSTLGDLAISTAQINGGNAKATTTSAVAVNLNASQAQPSKMLAATIPQTLGTGSPATAITIPGNYQLTITSGNTFNSVSKTVTVAAGPTTLSGLLSTLQTAVTTAFANSGVPTPVLTQNSTTGAISVASGSSGSQSQVQVLEQSGVGPVTTPLLFAGGAVGPVVGSDNFSTSNPNTYNSSTSETVYDSQGAQHSLTTYFAKTAIPGQWTAYFGFDGSQIAPLAGVPVSFDANGNITTATAKPAALSITVSPPPVTTTPLTGPSGASQMTVQLDFTGTTQFGTAFAVNQITQDGYPPGSLSGMSVDPKGIIQAHYSNGQQVNVAQVALASFQNPNGLQSVGSNQWQATVAAGSVNTNTPGASNLGILQAGAVEESNVDLTKELVNMITAQRAYQANAQSIKTEDQIMQTLVSLR